MMDPLRHVDDLVAAYVLGAVSPEEAERVKAHLTTCAECRALEDELREMEAALPALAGELEAPPGLKARVMAAVAAEPPRARPGDFWPTANVQPVRPPTSRDAGRDKIRPLPGSSGDGRYRTPRGRMLRPWLVAAAVLVVAAVGVTAWRLIGTGQSQPSAKYAMASTPAMPGITGQLAYFKGDNHFELTLRGLKPIPAGRVYELWFIRVRGQSIAPTPIVVFRPGPDGSITLKKAGYAVPTFNLAGLTIQHAAQVKTPTLPIVASATLG